MKYIKLFEKFEYEEGEEIKEEETGYILDLLQEIIDKYYLSRGTHEEGLLGNFEKLGSHYKIQYSSDANRIFIDTYCDVNTREYVSDMNSIVYKLEDLGYQVKVERHNELEHNPYLTDIKPGVVYNLDIIIPL